MYRLCIERFVNKNVSVYLKTFELCNHLLVYGSSARLSVIDCMSIIVILYVRSGQNANTQKVVKVEFSDEVIVTFQDSEVSHKMMHRFNQIFILPLLFQDIYFVHSIKVSNLLFSLTDEKFLKNIYLHNQIQT